MDTKLLRQKILDLAIRGKLVPQDPNDEPASVLLERIREQKQQMFKEGKLKKKDIKNDSVIFVGDDNLHYEKFADETVKCIEDEIPFEVPEGWAWCRLGIAFETITGGTPSTKDPSLYGNAYPFYKPADLDAGYNTYQAAAMVSEKGFLSGRAVSSGAVLVTCIGTIGKTGYIWNPGICNQQINAILPNEFMFSEYTYFMMCSEYEQNQIKENASATTLSIINKRKFDNLLFPVAPYRAQVEISQKVKEIFNVVDLIDNDKSTLQSVIAQMKSKILDLAIRGQLVPQNPDDEPASVLLERIRAEKEELIRQGKIKRDKKESVIFRGSDKNYFENDGKEIIDISDSLPFELPDSWSWSYLKDVFMINPRNQLEDTLDVSFVPMPLINDGYSGKHTSDIRKWKEIKSGFTHFAEGDIGIAKITPCFENRKSVIFKNLTNGFGAGTTELHILRPYNNAILAQYVLAYVKSNYFIDNGKRAFSGAVGQQRISKEYVKNSYFPIPPTEEQKRIIQKINILFEYLDIILTGLSQ